MPLLVGALFFVFAVVSVAAIFSVFGGGLRNITADTWLTAGYLAWPALIWGTVFSRFVGQHVELAWLRSAGASLAITVLTAFTMPAIWWAADIASISVNGSEIGLYFFAGFFALAMLLTYGLPLWVLGTTAIHYIAQAARAKNQ